MGDYHAELPFATEQMQVLFQLGSVGESPQLIVATQQLLHDAWELSSITYNMHDAIDWAEGFEFPKNIADRDEADLRKYGSLEKLCETRHAEVAHSKLSVVRVNKIVSEERLSSFNGQVDKVRALDIAAFGMFIPTSLSFLACSQPPPLRPKYVKVHTAVNKIIYQMYLKGSTVLIITTRTALTIPGIHFSATHWTTKKNKASGRILGDQSNDINGRDLNDVLGEARELVKDMWGPITHPTLADLALMILNEADKYGLENIVLWKMDLQGAFSLLRIRPQCIPKFAFALTNDLTLIHTAGMFGWTGTPFAFSIFSRLLEGCIQHDITGSLKVYVDDLCGCSSFVSSDVDQTKAMDICTGLLGDQALAADKHEQGRRLDMIGWSFDLDLQTVTVSRTNHLKTVYCMFMFQQNELYSLNHWQTTASRASRYVIVCPHMKPYTASFHRMCADFKGNTSILKKIPLDVWEDLQMWKAFMCLLSPFESLFSRKICTFRNELASVRIEYDASLTGLGFVVSKLSTSSLIWTVTHHVGMNFPFAQHTRNDSSYQNSCEFIAVVSALYVLWRVTDGNFTYELIGDNTTSLKWCSIGYAKSTLAKRASIAFTVLAVLGNFRLHSTAHVAGKQNVVCDALSRNQLFSDLDLPASAIVDESLMQDLSHLLTIINPSLPQVSFDAYHTQLLQFLKPHRRLRLEKFQDGSN